MTREGLGILWQEYKRWEHYPLRWPAIALIEAAQKIAAALEAEPLAEGMSQLYRFVQVGPPEVRLDSIFFSDKSFGLETGQTRKVRVIILPAEEDP